jgi:hypothetical protein
MIPVNTEATLQFLVSQIEQYLAKPFSTGLVGIPLLIRRGDADPILRALSQVYVPRYGGGDGSDLWLRLDDLGLASVLRIKGALTIYDASGVLGRPDVLRGDSCLAYVIDYEFEDYRSRYFERLMQKTLSSAKMSGFDGAIHRHHGNRHDGA